MIRALPDFAVIGAMRSGTTSLDSLLRQVPGLCMSRIKEPDYFIAELNHRKGPAWYASLFADHAKICGEVSPNYTSADRFPGVAARLHAAAPHAKLVYLVRDPVERVRSHYQHTWLKDSTTPAPADICDSETGQHILEASRYFRQIEPFLEWFPRERILVVESDDLRAQPTETLRRICVFIDERLGELDFSAIDTRERNSSKEVAAVPAWWVSTMRAVDVRMPALAGNIRAHVPRPFLRAVRGAVAQTTPLRQPPLFPPEVLERVKRELVGDALRFREFAGRAFADWSV